MVYGDLELVINHLRTGKGIGDILRPFYNQVRKLEEKLQEKKVCSVLYKPLNDSDPIYKKIDEIASQCMNLIHQKFQIPID